MHRRSRTLSLFAATLLLGAGAVATAAIVSGDKLRIVRGSTSADILVGSASAERIYGFAGDDKLYGLAGDDLVVAGSGKDRIWAGSGNDRIHARDGKRDIVLCGSGLDRVAADTLDSIGRDCERRDLNPKTLPAGPFPVAGPVTHRPSPPSSSPNPELTVRVSGAGTVTSSPTGIDCPGRCTAGFASGSTVALTAKPGPGQRIQGWGKPCDSTRSTCSVRMTGASTVGVTFSASDGSPAPPTSTPPPPPSGNSVVRSGSGWTCNGHVNLDLVRITSPPGDAIVLADGCTGRIGRIEVETWTADGVKIQNQSNPAHDVTIGGGYVRCHAIQGDAHQDAVQAMAGERIFFFGVSFDCLGNSNFFVNRAVGSHTPSDIVCDGCTFGGKSSTTVRVNVSLRSGVRNSWGCPGRNVREPFHFTSFAQSPVNSGNRQLPASDPLCR